MISSSPELIWRTWSWQHLVVRGANLHKFSKINGTRTSTIRSSKAIGWEVKTWNTKTRKSGANYQVSNMKWIQKSKTKISNNINNNLGRPKSTRRQMPWSSESCSNWSIKTIHWPIPMMIAAMMKIGRISIQRRSIPKRQRKPRSRWVARGKRFSCSSCGSIGEHTSKMIWTCWIKTIRWSRICWLSSRPSLRR